MGLRYQVEAQGLSGIPYRIDIYQDGYNSGASSLQSARNFVSFEGGTNEWTPTDVIWASELQLYLADPVDLSGLLDARDRAVRFESIRTDTGNLVFKGFFLTDLFEDEPYAKVPSVRLRAIDGLTLLEDSDLDSIYGANTTYAAYTDAIPKILADIYDTDLNVEFGVEWYPDESTLGSSDCPLRYVGFNPNNYREDRPDGDWFDLRTTLEDLLRSQGLVLRQFQPDGQDVKWQVRHRSAIDTDGSLRVWRFDSTGSYVSGPTTRNYGVDLNADKFEPEPRRSFERLWQSVSITHNHSPAQNILEEEGFESGSAGSSSNTDAWTFTNPNDGPQGTFTDMGVPYTPQKTSQNQLFLKIRDDDAGGVDSTTFNVEQTFDIASVPGGASYEFSFESGNAGLIFDSTFQLELNGYYITPATVDVRSPALNGETEVAVTALPAPIPKGAILTVVDTSQTAEDQVKGTFTVQEAASKNDERIRGTASLDINPSDHSIKLFHLTSSASNVKLTDLRRDLGFWQRSAVRVSAFADDGTLVKGNGTLRLGVTQRSSRGGEVREIGYDNVRLQVLVNGSVFDSNTTKISAPNFGQDISVSTRTNQGPEQNNIARLKGEDPNGDDYIPVNWGIGAGGGNRTLQELHGREWIRYFRDWTERLTLTFFSRDKSPALNGHELIEYDGKEWTISNIRFQPQSGRVQLELLEHVDYGIANITYERVLRSGEDGATGGGGTPGSGPGGGGTTIPYEIEAFVPGSLQPATYYIRHVARHQIEVQDVRIDANTAPSSNTDFIIDKVDPQGNITSIATITLTSGTNRNTFDISDTVIAVDENFRIRSDAASGNFSSDVERFTINVKAQEA